MAKHVLKSVLLLWIALAIAALAIGLAGALQSCIHLHKADAAYGALRDAASLANRLAARGELAAACAAEAPNGNPGTLLFLAAGLLAFFAFALWQSTERLWRESRLQLTAARRATRVNLTAARAARKSAAAAMRQAQTAEQALVDLARPYVFVDDLHFAFSPAPAISFSLTNYGATPAAMGSYRAALDIVARDPGAKDDRLTWAAPLAAAIAKDSALAALRLPLDQTVIDRIERGEADARLELTLAYRDIFGKRHRETAGYRYNAAARAFARDDADAGADETALADAL